MSPLPTISPAASNATAPAQKTSRPPGGVATTCEYGPTGADIPGGLIDCLRTRISGVAGQRPGRSVSGTEHFRLEEELLAHRVDLERSEATGALIAGCQLGAQSPRLVLVDPEVERIGIDRGDRDAVHVPSLLERQQTVDHVVEHPGRLALPGEPVATSAVGGEVDTVTLVEDGLGREHTEVLLVRRAGIPNQDVRSAVRPSGEPRRADTLAVPQHDELGVAPYVEVPRQSKPAPELAVAA